MEFARAHVLVCGGTGCTSSGSHKLIQEFEKQLQENHLEKNRIGISVSKKVGNSVVRHHLARLIREGYRLQEELFHIGYDVVIIVRVNGKDCTYYEIERAIYHLGKLHQIVEKKNRDENSIN